MSRSPAGDGAWRADLAQRNSRLTPEQKLWLAVVAQAVADATSKHHGREQRAALTWFTSPAHARARRRVCEYAGVDERALCARVAGGAPGVRFWRNVGRRGPNVSLM